MRSTIRVGEPLLVITLALRIGYAIVVAGRGSYRNFNEMK